MGSGSFSGPRGLSTRARFPQGASRLRCLFPLDRLGRALASAPSPLACPVVPSPRGAAVLPETPRVQQLEGTPL